MSLVSLHPLSNIDITKYFNYKPRFNDNFSRNNLPRINDGACVKNLDFIILNWVLLFVDKNRAVWFDSFGTEYVPQEVLKKTNDKSITDNIFRIQDDDSVMFGSYCIAFIGYMIATKVLLDYTNLLFPNYFLKNDKIIYRHFKDKYCKT